MGDFSRLLQYLSIASFALAVGALLARFREKDGGAKTQLVAALLVFVILASGATAGVVIGERSRTRALADEVVKVIDNQKMTFDDILSQVKDPDRTALSAALGLLDAQQRIGSVITPLSEADGTSHRVRTYYVRTFNQ